MTSSMKKLGTILLIIITIFGNAVIACATPDVVDWSSKQTSVKNQLDRRTCFDFAIIAAIESRYVRDYSLNLDLSEQYFHHLVKSTDLNTSGAGYSPYYKYENQSSYWGGGGSGCVSVAKDYTICLESDINYSSSIGVNRGYLYESEMNSLRIYINNMTGNSVGNLA